MTTIGSKRGCRLTGPSVSGSSEAKENPAEALLAEFRLMAARESAPLEMYPVVSDQVEWISPVATEAEADLIVVAPATSGVPKGLMDSAECAVLVVGNPPGASR